MRGRTILVLLIVLVVLVLVAIFFEARRNRATETSDAPLFEGLNTELVDRIRIIAEGNETILVKRDDQWTVATEDGGKAEQRFVTDILDRLPKFYSDNVVSTNPDKQSIFAVDSTGVEVWVDQEGEEIGHFVVGKRGPDFMSSYVRAAGSNRVILVAEELPSVFNKKGQSWREKTIFALTQEDIVGYEYESPTRGRFMISREEGGSWEMTEPSVRTIEGEDQNISMAVRAFSKLKAADFADTISAADAGIEADTTWVRATLADGSVHKITIGLPTESRRSYARKEGTDQIVLVPLGGLNTMMPPQKFYLD